MMGLRLTHDRSQMGLAPIGDWLRPSDVCWGGACPRRLSPPPTNTGDRHLRDERHVASEPVPYVNLFGRNLSGRNFGAGAVLTLYVPAVCGFRRQAAVSDIHQYQETGKCSVA